MKWRGGGAKDQRGPAAVPEGTVRLTAFVHGYVQGVGFRWFTQDTARREGAMGWVRNLPDGRVEAIVEGESEAVTNVERAIRPGPRGARVEQVDVDEQEVGGYRSFTIER